MLRRKGGGEESRQGFEVTFDLGLLEAGVPCLKLRAVASEGLCVYTCRIFSRK